MPARVRSAQEGSGVEEAVPPGVAAGAGLVFVGPNTDLTGPAGVVETLWNHDNHLHARFEERDRT